MASFDAVVVGAGPSGCVAAARLAESGRRTLVVEAGQRTPPPQLATPSIVDPAAVGDWSLAPD